MSLKFGLIFHWGPYSVPAYDNIKSLRRRKMKNGSEWYFKRLMIKASDYRPLAGWKETQEFHNENYQDQSYETFAREFGVVDNLKAKIKAWMGLANTIGAQYVILTAKHHDGYCLWDTKTDNPSSSKSECKMDILKYFAEQAREHNLLFGIYYSWIEFAHNCTIKFFNDVVIPQINELKTYKPDMWWFDGHWNIITKHNIQAVSDICKQLKAVNPKVQINDRLRGDKNNPYHHQAYLGGDATYRSYGDREVPDIHPGVPWENINTIGLSWGRNKQQEKSDYKSGVDLFDLYNDVLSKGGRLLLNLGPDGEGNLDPLEVEALIKFSELRKF